MSISLSIVVCTYNSSFRLSDCLASLLAQVGSPDYEVLIIDNASTDGSGELADAYLRSKDAGIPWRIIREERQGLVYARLAGLEAARFEWVLFCDDDNILFPDFLFQSIHILSANSRIGVLGSQGIPVFLGSKPDWFDRYSSSFAVGPQAVADLGRQNLVHVYGACSIYRKKPLINLFNKGFLPALSDRSGNQLQSGGDVEWCWLMQLLGLEVTYSDKLRFYHRIPESRLTWAYYLLLKRGIASGAGLLSVYNIYFSLSSKSLERFVLVYALKTCKSFLLYIKYWVRWGGRPSQPKDQLSFVILESQIKSYLSQGLAAFSHFNQLKRYFDT